MDEELQTAELDEQDALDPSVESAEEHEATPSAGDEELDEEEELEEDEEESGEEDSE